MNIKYKIPPLWVYYIAKQPAKNAHNRMTIRSLTLVPNLKCPFVYPVWVGSLMTIVCPIDPCQLLGSVMGVLCVESSVCTRSPLMLVY